MHNNYMYMYEANEWITISMKVSGQKRSCDERTYCTDSAAKS